MDDLLTKREDAKLIVQHDRDGRSPFSEAINTHKLPVADYLISKLQHHQFSPKSILNMCFLRGSGDGGLSLLHFAVANRNKQTAVECINYIVAKATKLDAGPDHDVIKQLLMQFSSLDNRPLHSAGIDGNVTVLYHLLLVAMDEKWQPATDDPEKRKAARKKRLSLVELLLRICNKDGYNLLVCASAGSSNACHQALPRDCEIIVQGLLWLVKPSSHCMAQFVLHGPFCCVHVFVSDYEQSQL